MGSGGCEGYRSIGLGLVRLSSAFGLVVKMSTIA